MNLEEMVSAIFSKWHAFDSPCEHCGSSRIHKADITSASQLVIIHLKIFSVQNQRVSKINNVNIKAVPTTILHIASKSYRVISAILHHGESINKGHYTCLLRQKNSKWIHADDCNIRPTRWLRGAKDAYMFILDNISQ
ncbi:uncharacterized protein LOC144478021 [Augochlora pura]